MSDEPPDEFPPGDIRDTMAPNPMPFVIALAGFLVVAVLAFVFLRDDEAGDLVRPDRLIVVDDETIRAVALERSACERIIRAQVELAEEAIFVELVVEETAAASGEECTLALVPLQAEITLPEPVDGRGLRAGVGRLEIPCADPGSSVTCAPDR